MKVTVVIPCHNVEALVASAVDSALAQDQTDLEVIAVDDGSTDGTLRILEGYAQAHPDRVRVIRQANLGAGAARNAGMQAGTGEWLQFLDADDVILHDKIGGQLAVAGDADVVVGDYEQLMPDGLLLSVEALHGQPWMALIRTRMGTTSANLWKRGTLEAVGGWNEQQASSQDYELLFRLLANGATVAWDRRIRTHVLKRASGSISLTDVRANWERYIALRRAIKEHLQQQDPRRHAREIEVLRQYIFMALRIVAVDDLPWAVAEYKRSIGKGFHPEVSRAITERYVLLHNLLGFEGAERVTRLAKRR